MLNNTSHSPPLMQAAMDKCTAANVQHEFIPLPEDLPLDIASHIKFHGITKREAVPTLIFKTENGFIAVQKRADTKIDSSKLKKLVGVKSLNFANSDDLEKIGAEVGIVPLVGLTFAYFIDQKVMEIPTVYGGSGSKLYALKLASTDLAALNNATIGNFTEII